MIVLAEWAPLSFPGSSCVVDGVCTCLEVVITKKGSSAEAPQPLHVHQGKDPQWKMSLTMIDIKLKYNW